MGSALVCVELELGVGPMFEPNKFGGVGKKKAEAKISLLAPKSVDDIKPYIVYTVAFAF